MLTKTYHMASQGHNELQKNNMNDNNVLLTTKKIN